MLPDQNSGNGKINFSKKHSFEFVRYLHDHINFKKCDFFIRHFIKTSIRDTMEFIIIELHRKIANENISSLLSIIQITLE